VLYRRVPRLPENLSRVPRGGRDARMRKTLARVQVLILEDWRMGNGATGWRSSMTGMGELDHGSHRGQR
jgi:hypothetical protein